MKKIIVSVFLSFILLTGISTARVEVVNPNIIVNPNCGMCVKGQHNKCPERSLRADPGTEHNPNCCCIRSVTVDEGGNGHEHNNYGYCTYCGKNYCSNCYHACDSLCKYDLETGVKCYSLRGDNRYCEKHTCNEEGCLERVYFINESFDYCYKHICFKCLGKHNKSASLNNLCDVCRKCEYGLHEFSESGDCNTPKTCAICNQLIETSHNYIWKYEGEQHYKVCEYCGETSEKEGHILNIESYVDNGNSTRKECICGYYEDELGKLSIKFTTEEIFLTKDETKSTLISRWKKQKDNNGNEEDKEIGYIEAEKCKWGSSNKKVATVDSKGIITGKSCGVAYITAVYGNGLTASLKVVVRACTIVKIEYKKYDEKYHIKGEICKNGCVVYDYIEHAFDEKTKICKPCGMYNCLHENTKKEECLTWCERCGKLIEYNHYDGCPCEEGTPGKPKKVKTLVIYIDPIITDSEGNIMYKENGEPFRYSDYKKLDRDAQLNLYMDILNSVAPEHINYDIVGTEGVDNFDDFAKLTQKDGTIDFTQDVTLSLGWLESADLKGQAIGYLDYDLLTEMYNLDERKLAGEFDEVVIVGTDELGAYESVGANGGATIGYIGSEDEFKTTFVNMNQMGGTECYAHSLEYLFNEIFSPTSTITAGGSNLGYDSYELITMSEEEYNSLTPWEKFCLNRVRIKDGNGEIWAGPGTVHFSPNSEDDYNWGSEETTYYRDPKTGEVVPYSSSIYTNNPYYNDPSLYPNMASHHAWWFSQLPTGEGRDENGYSNDWWVYAQSCDFVSEVKGGSYEMKAGESKDISFNLTYKSGKKEIYTVNGYETYVSVSNSSVASFSGGKLIAKKEGTCVVTLKYDGRQGDFYIIVAGNKCRNSEHVKDINFEKKDAEWHIRYESCSICGEFEIEEMHEFSNGGKCECGIKRCLDCLVVDKILTTRGLCLTCSMNCSHSIINNNICDKCGSKIIRCLDCLAEDKMLTTRGLCLTCYMNCSHSIINNNICDKCGNKIIICSKCGYKGPPLLGESSCKCSSFDSIEKENCSNDNIIKEHKDRYYEIEVLKSETRNCENIVVDIKFKKVWCEVCDVYLTIRESTVSKHEYNLSNEEKNEVVEERKTCLVCNQNAYLYSGLCHWCMRDKCYEAGHNYSWNPDSIKSDGKTTHYGSFSCIECGYENMPTYFNHKYDDNDVCIVCYYKHEHDFSNGGICECGEQTNRCLVCNTEQTNLYSGYCNSCKADECEAKGHQQYWRNIFKCENTHKGVVQCAEESNNCGYYWVNKEFNHRIVNGICEICEYKHEHDFSNGGICECGEQTNRCLVCNTEQTNLYSGYCNSCKADECEAKGHQQYWRNIFKCENTHKGVVQCAEESNNCGYYWVNKEFNHRIVNGICNVCGYEKK